MNGTHTHGQVIEVTSLRTLQRDQMFELMGRYFEGLDRGHFEDDLNEKQWVVMLNNDGRLCGFSTLCATEDTVCGEPVRAFFSGDTIVDRDHWGSLALENAWAKFVFLHVAEDPGYRWFWFLICKGYRTFRYLPVYFKHYYPRPGHALPGFERRVLDQLAGKRFGDHYCAETGIIHAPLDYKLRPGVGDIADRELRNPAIAFFQEKNPHWRQGAELACLAELNASNLTPAASRFIRGVA